MTNPKGKGKGKVKVKVKATARLSRLVPIFLDQAFDNLEKCRQINSTITVASSAGTEHSNLLYFMKPS